MRTAVSNPAKTMTLKNMSRHMFIVSRRIATSGVDGSYQCVSPTKLRK